MRSFSNLWYWIALAVVWSSSSHWVLGVPFDMVTRARRHGGEAEMDLHDIVRVNVNRILFITDFTGIWIIGFGSFGLTALVLLGFVYEVEFAQAVFLLAAPMSLVFWLSVRTAHGIREADGADLYRRLHRHRFITQVIGMISIFITAFWGMWQNMSHGVL
ncbi:component of SufBCD complex [Tropicimonas sp. IMCC6043]|uniref:component of SufBCD complex n=1 Tax=Tropicimonas sp. IMCC6043 TaxID=2510645 RepID=UPI00101B9E8E|nr:component of SufBCD complex [Tropicimonas sp. IMCC6043]RYH10450.1 component of SufBCD complex [Tropicimonas sp. IMCC6043]